MYGFLSISGIAAILVAMAICANTLLPAADHLPMQWGIAGKVN